MIKKAILGLLAGYAGALLAAHAGPPLESLRNPMLKGPLRMSTNSDVAAFAGRTTLSSGTGFVTISTAAVSSDSLIFAQFVVATTAPGSGQGYQTVVSSIVDGKSFAYGYTDGIGRGPGGTVLWEVRPTK